MSIHKFILAIGSILLITIFSIGAYQNELTKTQLYSSGKKVKAIILDLRCGRKDYIKLKVNGKEEFERIYLSSSECENLRTQKSIDLLMDSEGRIIFANKNYNDSFKTELVAIVLLALFFVYVIVRYLELTI